MIPALALSAAGAELRLHTITLLANWEHFDVAEVRIGDSRVDLSVISHAQGAI